MSNKKIIEILISFFTFITLLRLESDKNVPLSNLAFALDCQPLNLDVYSAIGKPP